VSITAVILLIRPTGTTAETAVVPGVRLRIVF